MCNLTSNTIGALFNLVTCNINKFIIPFIFALALAAFIWGVVQFFILNSDEEAKREQGKQFIIWGLVALAVMLSVWGLVRILGNTFGINTNVIPCTSTGTAKCPGGAIDSGGGGSGSGGGGGGGGVPPECLINPSSFGCPEPGQ